MKIIATGDWHIGNLFHGNDRLLEHKHFFEWLLEQIRIHRPEALLVAGDVFDTANPSAAAQETYYEFIADATQTAPDMKIIISAGNHDSAFRLEAPKALLSRHNVEIRGNVSRKYVTSEDDNKWVTEYDDLIIPLTGKDGVKVAVLVVPFLRSDKIDGNSYSEGVNDFLRNLTKRGRELFPDHQLVMMAHMYAKGSEIASKDASEKIMIGGQEEVNLEGWNDHPHYFTSGHIHKRQHIWNTDWARYSGSILPMSFAEIGYRHGVDLITLSENRKPKSEFLEYLPQHGLMVLPENEEGCSHSELKNLIKKLPQRDADGKLTGKFSYLLLKVKQEKVNNDEIKELEDLLRFKDVVLCKIQKIVPMLDISEFTSDHKINNIDDVLKRDPLETLKETFLIMHKREMSPHQEEMLEDLLKSLKAEE